MQSLARPRPLDEVELSVPNRSPSRASKALGKLLLRWLVNALPKEAEKYVEKALGKAELKDPENASARRKSAAVVPSSVSASRPEPGPSTVLTLVSTSAALSGVPLQTYWVPLAAV